MYQVSEAYKNAMKQPVQQFRMMGTVGTIPFEDRNILQGSFSITNQCSDNTEVKIGQVYIGELNVTLMGLNLPKYSLKGRAIKPKFGLRLPNHQYEDIPLGVYLINEAEWTASGVVVKAYDNMSKLDKACNVSSVTAMPYALAKMACNNCGLELGTTDIEFSKFANGSEVLSMYTENDVETWRDFMSWIAQTCACNVFADRDGKIIFRSYNQDVVDTIAPEQRFSGGSFSDFETRYTGLSCVNIAEKTTSYYGSDVDDGLTYNLGQNPFLQYGVDEAQAGQRRAVLDALKMVDYVPFKINLMGNPAYDLMDVFSFPDGLGDGEKLFCMTKYTFTYHGSYRMQGVGKNPALANAKSKTDKDLSGILSSQADEGMHYTVFTNADPLTVADGENKSVMFIRFIAQKTTHVVIDMEFLLKAETTEEGEEFNWTENDAVVTVRYFLNGEEITTHYPVETWQDGKHVLRLRYDLQAVAAQIHTWDVWMEMHGGQIDFEPQAMIGVVMGTGLAGESEWDGNIRADDDFHPIHFEKMFGKMDASVKMSGHIPLSGGAVDRFTGINFFSMFKGLRDDFGATSDVMAFTPYVNADKITTSCEHNSTVGWIGAGTTALNTALTVTTINMTDVKKITTKSSNAIFYASFDDGLSWVGWTEKGWVEGASMIKDEIEAVPESAWKSGGQKVMIQTVLETDASLFTLDVYGGKVGT